MFRALFILLLAGLVAGDQCATMIDIELVLDGSTSISNADWQNDIKFLSALASSFQIGEGAAHFGITQFASTVVQELDMTGDVDDVEEAILNLTQLNGGTAMGSGLSEGQNDLTQNGRKNAKKLAILITDGVSNEGPNPVPIASSMKANGTTIICVGVGTGIDKNVLSQIASSPDYLFAVSDFGALQTILNELALKTCVKIDSIQPNSGPQAGGTATVITGEGFELSNGTVFVKFGGQSVKGVYVSDNQVGAVAPPGTGDVDIEVSFDGDSFTSGSDVYFTYESTGSACPGNCSGHGVCLGSGKCLCNNGYTGPACATQECPGGGDCSGHGVCQNDGTCQCDQGWSGEGCSESSCSQGCVNGQCVGANRCVCNPGFQGPSCSSPLIVCCHYCGIYNPRTQWSASCDRWTPGGPEGSPCQGYSDRKLVKWWVQGSPSQGNCTSTSECIFPAGVWTYPRACISNYGYCN